MFNHKRCLAFQRMFLAFLAIGLAATSEAVQLPTATPVPGTYIIDNFCHDSADPTANCPGADWWVSNSQVYTLDPAEGVGGDYSGTVGGNTLLRIKYNKPTGEEWAFVAAGGLTQTARQTDFSVANQISVQVYGAVSLLIKFRDQNGNESQDSGILPAGSASVWSTVTWNYSGIAWNQCDRTHIEDVLLFIQPGQTGSGTCYLDSLVLGTPLALPQPDTNPLIENFDNDANFYMTAQQRNPRWLRSSTAYSLTVQTTDLNPTPHLLVVYNKPAGDEWAFLQANGLMEYGNRCDFSAEHQLSMHVLGSTTLLIKFRDQYGNESGDSGVLSVNSPDAWTSLTWDYSNVSWNQCDPHQISDILFFALPGQAGAGTFCLDNIKLGPPAVLPVANTRTPTPTATVTVTATPTATVTTTLTAAMTFTPTPTCSQSATITQSPTVSPTWATVPDGLIDNFDNDASPASAPGQRDGEWYGMPAAPGGCTITAVGTVGNASLLVQWNNPNFQYFGVRGLNASGKKTDFSQASAVTFKCTSAYDQGQQELVFIDINGNAANSAYFSVSAGTNTYSVNLPNLATYGVDAHNINEIRWKTMYVWGSLQLDDFWAVSPTPTPTPTIRPAQPYDPGLVDDFDNDASLASTPNQRDGEWHGGITGISLGSDSTGNHYLVSTIVSYSALSSSFYVTGLNAPGKKSDFSLAKYLEFSATANVSDYYPEGWPGPQYTHSLSVAATFTDQNGNYCQTMGTVNFSGTSTTWSGVIRLPLGGWGTCDPTHINTITFNYTINYPTGGVPMSCTFTLDRLRAGGEIYASNTVVDNFDNDNSFAAANGQADAAWSSSNSQVYTLAMATNIGGDSSPCLSVTYNKPTGEEYAFLYAGSLMGDGKFHDFFNAPCLTMNVYGAASFLVKFMDVNGNQSGDSTVQAATNSSGWNSVGFDLNSVAWGACDRHQVQEILIFVNPGQTGSGSFCLDDLMVYLPSASGSNVKALHLHCSTWTPTASPTATPSPTVSVTPLPATMTPTPMPTSTSTPTRDIPATGVTAYPNPARGKVNFVWSSGATDRVRIEIYNLSGERVATVSASRPGSNSAAWITERVSPGIYLYQIFVTQDGHEQGQGVRKIAVIK